MLPSLFVPNAVLMTIFQDLGGYGKNCVDSFMSDLIKKHEEVIDVYVHGEPKKEPKFHKIIVIAHNGSGFDTHFILKYIYRSDKFKSPSIIMNGTKIIQVKIDRVKFIDSLMYFQKPLSELPKMFGFEGCKGYYPYYFNMPCNDIYIGKIPDKNITGTNQ